MEKSSTEGDVPPADSPSDSPTNQDDIQSSPYSPPEIKERIICHVQASKRFVLAGILSFPSRGRERERKRARATALFARNCEACPPVCLRLFAGVQFCLKNKAVYKATEVACGWAGAVIKKVI